MPTLRLTQSTVSWDKYRVEAALEGNGLPRQIATAEFSFDFSPQDSEDLRWYLEDYLQHAADPAPKIAARIEGRLAEIGIGLFKALFHANDDARDLWAALRDRLNHTRVEIISGVLEATALPWELLRDPKTDTPLALRASAFVRAAHQAAQRAHLPQGGTGPIRILLVICRPGGSEDVPFRSVASRLIKGLDASARQAYQLDVLRPPTFEQLSDVLRRAKNAGEPYHVVHFDGHGAYVKAPQSGGISDLLRHLSPLMLSALRGGSHGYLIFENPALEGNHQLVGGPALGKLLVEAEVPVLVLNACRSAHAEAPAEPEQAPEGASAASAGANADVHTKVRAFGSLAQEVVDAGVAGVVAMRYNVYVATAAQFVADLYESLAGGQALGEAVTLGRKQLEAQPLREIAYTPRPLQDWIVPIVYEVAPVALFSRPVQKVELKITVNVGAAAPTSGGLARELERRPDAGFFGRDETLLALDRAFDTQPIVLLHAYAGSGKTSTAAEFARWYHVTGGIDGPVLFTSFEQKTTLLQALNENIDRVFGRALEQSGIHWLALPDEARRDVALQVLAQIPVMWIWDNVEPVAGFPAGTPSAWSTEEQQALADFLRSARNTKAKFLLTSRRDERGWLGDELPMRIKVPPMPMQERVQLARALSEKHGRRLTDVEDWLPLLRFTAGNPLTITVLAGQVLRDSLKTKEQMAAFVAQLRAGEKVFADEESEGRSKSLGVSLSYGFKHAFTDAERPQLALLHLFQGFVDVDVLKALGDPKADWCLPAVRGLTREAGIALLDRAAEIGLLIAHGAGYYSIHPALPWFFKNFFERYFPKREPTQNVLPQNPGDRDLQESAIHAYVKAVGDVSTYYQHQFASGDSRAVTALNAEESNLMNALQMARSHLWHDSIIDLMSGIAALYRYRGRKMEWKTLVDAILDTFVDEQTNMAKAGLEEHWITVMGWRGTIARELKDFEDADRVFNLLLKSARLSAAPTLKNSNNSFTQSDSLSLFRLSNALFLLGTFQGESLNPSCVASLSEAFDICIQLDNREGASSAAFHLGHAYMDIPTLRDFTKADDWYRKSLDLGDKGNRLKYATRLHELGQVCYARFSELSRSDERRNDVLTELVNKAAEFAYEALDVLPEDATEQRMYVHHLLGNIYDDAGDTENALDNYRKAIRLSEGRDDIDAAAKFCREVARCLLRANRLQDALEYANESLRKLQKLGQGATSAVTMSQQLVDVVRDAMRTGG